jgi:hypothetical protein
MPNNEAAGPTTKTAMESRFYIRAKHTNQDLKPVAPGWAQPFYVFHTAGIIRSPLVPHAQPLPAIPTSPS